MAYKIFKKRSDQLVANNNTHGVMRSLVGPTGGFSHLSFLG